MHRGQARVDEESEGVQIKEHYVVPARRKPRHRLLPSRLPELHEDQRDEHGEEISQRDLV